MTAPGGDQAVVSVLVRVPPSEAFRVFTEEIDIWWRRGMRYRLGKGRSVIHLEPKLGGRLFESFELSSGRERVIETGRVTTWEPAARLVLEWRAVNFAPHESTEVEVSFEASAQWHIGHGAPPGMGLGSDPITRRVTGKMSRAFCA